MRTDLPFIVYEFKVYVRNMSDKELHQEIVGQWNATGKDFDEDEMNIMVDELDRRSKAHEALDKMVAENQRLGLYDDAVTIKPDRVDETAKGEHEPIGWLDSEGRFSYFKHLDSDVPLYLAPPKRDSSSWVGLTHREMQELMSIRFVDDAVLATEEKLKEKNT